MYGYVEDNDKTLQTKSGGKFGLNQKVTFNKFEYNPLAGKDGAVGDALDIEIQIGEKEFNTRFYDVSRVYGKDGDELASDDDGYEAIKVANIKQMLGTINHYIKSLGVTDDQLKAMQSTATSFVDWVKKTCSLLPANYTSVPVDIFLQWQWAIRDNADKTYLELPKNMKGGYFIHPHVAGEFKEVQDAKGISYVTDAGQVHPITKDAGFMESPRATQQKEGADAQDLSTGSAPATTSGSAQKTSW